MPSRMPTVERKQEEFEMPSPALIAGLRFVGHVIGKIAWRIGFCARENIPEENGRGLLIASNHQTYLDPYWICLPVHRALRFMAWDRAFEWFLVGPVIRKLGAFPVNLDKGSVTSMKESLRVLKDGSTLVIFPEGSRAFADGALREFKPGAARLALQAEVPVLPVTIRGGNEVWPRGRKFPLPGKIEIVYHEPIETSDFLPEKDEKDRAEALTEKIRNVIASAL